jgi:hypothetical protein
MPQIAGVHISHELTLEVAHLLHDAGHEDVADALVTALEQERPIVALTPLDTEALVGVLDDPPVELAELRLALVAEIERRKARGF